MDAAQEERYRKLESLCNEILGNMSVSEFGYRDMIEEVTFDYDETGIFMTFEGDFVRECLRYLRNSDESDRNYNKMTFKISRSDVGSIAKESNSLEEF
jgi:hypothetical protein